jgi:hypothetical protein
MKLITYVGLIILAHVFFSGSFIYNIGRANGLIGAVVKGVEYGDTRMIQSFALPLVRNPRLPRSPELNVYPNPFESIMISEIVASSSGTYLVSMYDSMGRRLYRTSERLLAGQRACFEWDPSESGLSSGMVLVQVIGPHGAKRFATALFIR